MRVLLVGHACSPRQGSEPSFTWNWAWELSQRNGVWVIAHPHDRIGVEKFLADQPARRRDLSAVEQRGILVGLAEASGFITCSG